MTFCKTINENLPPNNEKNKNKNDDQQGKRQNDGNRGNDDDKTIRGDTAKGRNDDQTIMNDTLSPNNENDDQQGKLRNDNDQRTTKQYVESDADVDVNKHENTMITDESHDSDGNEQDSKLKFC